MTITRPAIVRLTAAGAVALGLVLGINSAQAGMMSGLGASASLHRMSNGKIAFVGGFADGSLDVINPDGSGLRRLRRCKTRECMIIDAVWSPDVSRIAFARALHGCVAGCPTEPFIVNADGSGLRRLSSLVGTVPLLWSPDGRTIAFSGHNGIYAVNPNGSHLRLLVPAPPNRANRLQTVAGWSPDGKHILYVSNPGEMGPGGPQATALWVMNANGTGRRRLYRAGHGYIGVAIWSPDGQRIAFSGGTASRSGLSVMGADGRHLHRLVARSYDLAWQPIP